MNRTLSQFSRFIVVALMLFMQSATITHALEHDVSEHTEHCAAFTTAEQVASGPDEFGCVKINRVNDYNWLTKYSSLDLAPRLKKRSRAPPSTL